MIFILDLTSSPSDLTLVTSASDRPVLVKPVRMKFDEFRPKMREIVIETYLSVWRLL